MSAMVKSLNIANIKSLIDEINFDATSCRMVQERLLFKINHNTITISFLRSSTKSVNVRRYGNIAIRTAIQGVCGSMLFYKRMPLICLSLFTLVGMANPSSGDVITFTGDAALVSALGGTLSTGVTRVAQGQTVSVPFGATVAGVESVSGTVVLMNTASGGSIQLENVVFTVLDSTSTDVEFGLSVSQAYTHSGPTVLNTLNTLEGGAHLTQMGSQIEPGSVVESGSLNTQYSIKPDNGNNSYSAVPYGSTLFAFPSSTFPSDQSVTPYSSVSTGIPKTSNNPVIVSLTYSTSISTFNATTGADSSTTLSSASIGFIQASSVPEPSVLTLSSVVVVALGVVWRRRAA